MRGKLIMLLAMFCLLLLLPLHWWTSRQMEETNREIEQLRVELQAQEQQREQLELTRDLLQEVITLRQENEELRRQVEEWLKTWEVAEFETTAYAPLDPRAVEGMCYQGDPSITASGEKVQPGVTVAAGPSVPYGTRVWIEGHGWRIVQDRGGRITDRHIDVAVGCQDEAVAIGRQSGVLAVVERW